MKMSFREPLHGFPGDVKAESRYLLGSVLKWTGLTQITLHWLACPPRGLKRHLFTVRCLFSLLWVSCKRGYINSYKHFFLLIFFRTHRTWFMALRLYNRCKEYYIQQLSPPPHIQMSLQEPVCRSNEGILPFWGRPTESPLALVSTRYLLQNTGEMTAHTLRLALFSKLSSL